jgi:heme/copper-type cytochrome/quinol oxidase subunit 2
VDALEIFYTSLLVLVFLLVTWFSVYVVWKLYKGQD